jgi:hypothetical protein
MTPPDVKRLREMLREAIEGRTRMRIPPHADDTDLLLCGAIEELLESRAEAARLRAERDQARDEQLGLLRELGTLRARVGEAEGLLGRARRQHLDQSPQCTCKLHGEIGAFLAREGRTP